MCNTSYHDVFTLSMRKDSISKNPPDHTGGQGYSGKLG